MYQLTEIKKLRTKLGINQKELAFRSGVSQSLIAKIESGKIEPTYNKTCQIIEALKSLEEKVETKAQELMNKKLLFARPRDKIKTVIKVMKKKGISQLPVIKNKVVCGIITERNILEKISEKVGELKVEELMEQAPPIISLKTSQRIVLELLKENSIVLVAEKGDIKGIITKSDLLGRI